MRTLPTLDDDSAGGLFAIDSNTGIVTVAGGLDYETASSHNITIRATSTDGSFATEIFAINVTDVNESGVSWRHQRHRWCGRLCPRKFRYPARLVGVTAFADDADGTDTVTYSLDDDAGGRFTIDANTGVVTVAGANRPRSRPPSYDITVRATSPPTPARTTQLVHDCHR